MKLIQYSILYIFLLSCNINQGFESMNFYTESETEKKIGIAVSLKAFEIFRNTTTLLPYEFQEDPNCKRQSYYKKEQVNKCINIILVSNLQTNDISDFFGKIGVIVNKVCNLERQVFLDNSNSGELNFCGVK